VNFWARRTRRILPSALLVIAVTLIAGSFVVSDLTLFYAARDAIYAALYIINWQQLAESLDYFDDRVGNGLFLHYWSLAIEKSLPLSLPHHS
jgi:peptidoglycan/LPS O-acetylase OafA/YrhL